MSKSFRVMFLSVAIASLVSAAGCGGGGDPPRDGGGDAATTPTVTITMPTAGGMVAATSGMVPISWTSTNFTFAAPGMCAAGTVGTCGHVHLNVDGMACNAAGMPYNVAGIGSPTNANMMLCPAGMMTGSHTFRIELRNNDHTPLSPPVFSEVNAIVM